MLDSDDWSMILKITLTILMLLTGWLSYLFVPDMLEARRDAVRASSGYVEATKSRLLRLSGEYNDCKIKIRQLSLDSAKFASLILDYRNQMSILLESIREESSKIPEHELPGVVHEILSR